MVLGQDEGILRVNRTPILYRWKILRLARDSQSWSVKIKIEGLICLLHVAKLISAYLETQTVSSAALIINRNIDKLFEYNKQVELKRFITLVMVYRKGKKQNKAVSLFFRGKSILKLHIKISCRLVFCLVYGFNSNFLVQALWLLPEEPHIFYYLLCQLWKLTTTWKYIDRQQTSFGVKLKYARYLSADIVCSN